MSKHLTLLGRQGQPIINSLRFQAICHSLGMSKLVLNEASVLVTLHPSSCQHVSGVNHFQLTTLGKCYFPLLAGILGTRDCNQGTHSKATMLCFQTYYSCRRAHHKPIHLVGMLDFLCYFLYGWAAKLPIPTCLSLLTSSEKEKRRRVQLQCTLGK